ncbi:hypothetical protein BC938DRAFT_470869 [Jimgerdemannia flammicorona]|uniref:Uncharacterized protein n=1 Tax=Jimgerdemannia flammicorona TaxID=994334 RepID=A0A433Q9C3_9FUNG|nr:hypothetical protein BC938DRAFT_470869 [Jimgerdemannia flammicorona]
MTDIEKTHSFSHETPTFEELTAAIIEEVEVRAHVPVPSTPVIFPNFGIFIQYDTTLDDYIITCKNIAEDAEKEVLKNDVVLRRTLKRLQEDEALEVTLLKRRAKIGNHNPRPTRHNRHLMQEAPIIILDDDVLPTKQPQATAKKTADIPTMAHTTTRRPRQPVSDDEDGVGSRPALASASLRSPRVQSSVSPPVENSFAARWSTSPESLTSASPPIEELHRNPPPGSIVPTPLSAVKGPRSCDILAMFEVPAEDGMEDALAKAERRSARSRRLPLASVSEAGKVSGPESDRVEPLHVRTPEYPRSPLRRSTRPLTMVPHNYDVVAMMRNAAGDDDDRINDTAVRLEYRGPKRRRTQINGGGGNVSDSHARGSKCKPPQLRQLPFEFAPGDHYYAYKWGHIFKILGGDTRRAWKNFNEAAARDGKTPYMLNTVEWHPFLPHVLTLSHRKYLHWAEQVRVYGKPVAPSFSGPPPGANGRAIRMFVKATVGVVMWCVDLGWVKLGEPVAREWSEVPASCIENSVQAGRAQFRVCVPEVLMDVPLIRVRVIGEVVDGWPIVCRAECRREWGVNEVSADADVNFWRRFTFCHCLEGGSNGGEISVKTEPFEDDSVVPGGGATVQDREMQEAGNDEGGGVEEIDDDLEAEDIVIATDGEGGMQNLRWNVPWF